MIDSDREIISSLVEWVQSLNMYKDEEDPKTHTLRNVVMRHILEKIESRLSK